MKNWKATLMEIMTAIVLALLILALVPAARAAGDLPPEAAKPPVVIQPQYEVVIPLNCTNGLCIVPERVMLGMGKLNAGLAAENDGLRAELDKAKAGKKCAVIEVLPPSRGGKS
jgi:hypothetical protein